jgi:hypothetical protein
VIEQSTSVTPAAAGNTPALSFVHVSKQFPQASGSLEVLRDVSFDLPAREIVAIVRRRRPDGSNIPDFYFLRASLNLVKGIEELGANIRAQCPKPATLARSIAGCESFDKDMGAYIRCRELRARDPAIAVVSNWARCARIVTDRSATC